jgi:lipopolysaccharide export system protein LptA
MAFGGVGWTTPSTMAKTGHLYSFDAKQNATFPNNIKTSSGDIIASTGNLYIKQSSEDKNSTGNATIEGKVIVGDSITVKDGAG